jgi:hypothetical protein
MDDTNFLIGISIIIVTFFVIVLIFRFYVNYSNQRRNTTIIPYSQYLTTNGSEYRECPVGCKRGVCEEKRKCDNFLPPNPECCAHDYQCSYCDSSKTESSFLAPGSSPAFSQALDDADENNRKSVNGLIEKQNRYIIDVNKQIMKDNTFYNKRMADLRNSSSESTSPSETTSSSESTNPSEMSGLSSLSGSSEFAELSEAY